MREMTHKLLVALDASDRAEGVFRTAVGLAEPLGATLHLLRVVTVPPEFPPAGHVSRVDLLPAYLAQQAALHLREFAQQTPHLQVETSVVQSSEPWRAIIDEADRSSADLIVVGSHGYHGIDHLLGTTAGKVANLARRNVLVVHQTPAKPSADTYRSTAKPPAAPRS
jgi:nucleotide-binding universal stress UspA family protein